VRIGIGHPGDKERVLGHVLGDFHKADQPWVEELVTAIADSIGLLVAGDDGRFMNKVALVTAPKPKKGDAAA
jgi:PTH1 family peptidyl-tRNA hydrolase